MKCLLNLNNDIFIFKNGGDSMKIFVDTGEMDQSAHFGWQNKDDCMVCGKVIKIVQMS